MSTDPNVTALPARGRGEDEKQTCVACGKDSADGDWYHICGKCRWNQAGESRSTALRGVITDLAAALKAVTEHMDRAGGDACGMPECPWCKAGPDGNDHRPDCELEAARDALAKVSRLDALLIGET